MGIFTLPARMALASLLWGPLLVPTGCNRMASGGRGSAAENRQVPGDAAAPERSGGGLRYAKVFSLDTKGNATQITVHNPWQGANQDFRYLLVPRDRPRDRPAGGDTQTVAVPLRRAVTLTTTNLPHLEAIGALDALVGVGSGRNICSPAVRARLASGRLRDVGDDMHLDLESLVALRPDLLFTYVVGGSSDGGLAKLAEAGLPAAVEGSYMEETPLGRAEWIKFTAAFFGKSAAADSVFAEIDSSYRALAALGARAARKPTVVVGAPFGGSWWVAGGRSYVARLLADAGADYPWADDTTRGSLNLDLEAVLAKAGGAEFWLNVWAWKDLADARAQDERYALFRAFRAGNVWNNDRIRCAEGGHDFFETGASRPDWVLADLIAILHPELLPGHEMRWYRRLPAGPGAEKEKEKEKEQSGDAQAAGKGR
jgi:iron complex transport system substrate-binding protein